MNCFNHLNISSKTFMFSIVDMKFWCYINNLVWQMD